MQTRAIEAEALESQDPGSVVSSRVDSDWEAVYRQLGERVFRMIHRITGDSELAADLTHDTFVRAIEKAHQHDGRGPLAAWIFSIAGNMARDFMRKRHRRFLRAANLSFGRERGSTNAPDIESKVELRYALEELPESHRVVVFLHDVDGYTHAEIAEMLDIAVGTSKARLSRAHVKLRSALRQTE